MGSYSVVLAPMGAILAADYTLVKHAKIDVPELYNKPHGIYRYSRGINWRSAVALVCAIGPNLPGMINAINPAINIGGAKYIYAIADIFGMVVGASVHVMLSYMFPDATSEIDYNLSAEEALLLRGATVPNDENTDEEKRFPEEVVRKVFGSSTMPERQSLSAASDDQGK